VSAAKFGGVNGVDSGEKRKPISDQIWGVDSGKERKPISDQIWRKK
jgi:hypothetical protein